VRWLRVAGRESARCWHGTPGPLTAVLGQRHARSKLRYTYPDVSDIIARKEEDRQPVSIDRAIEQARHRRRASTAQA
jgi:hypothetical protein